MTHQTATVSDEAVRAAIKASPYVVKNDTMQWMRRALTATLPYLTASVEVGDVLDVLNECLEYFDNLSEVDYDQGVAHPNREMRILSDVKDAQAVLSALKSKPVDVAAVRKQAFEEAAQVAEIRHEKWSNGDGFHDSEGLPAVSCDVTACENIASAIRALSPAEPVDQWQDMKALSELSKLTYAIQHNPNCPDKYLVRLPGNGGIDLKHYGNAAFRVPNQTNDILGFGKTLHEAYIAATAAPTSKGGE